MRKLITLLCVVCSVAMARATTPGSYAPVTIKITASRSLVSTTENADGSLSVKSTVAEKTITNAAILAALQKKGVIPAGSLSGWQLYACFDQYGDFLTLIAAKGSSARMIDSIAYYEPAGIAEAATIKLSATDKFISGSSSQKVSGYLTVILGGVEYYSTVTLTGSYGVVAVNTRLKVAKPGPYTTIALSGFADNGAVLTGSLSTGNATAAANLENVFPDL